MVNTAISDIGEQIQCSGGAESLEPILGDGAVKAGMACGKLTTGKAIAVDGDSATAGISFAGIMDRHYSVALDTAITDALANNVIVPKSGRIYRVFIEDPGATVLKGAPMTFGQTTAGSFKVIGTEGATGTLTRTLAIDDTVDVVEEPIVAYLESDQIVNGDTVGYIRWA